MVVVNDKSNHQESQAVITVKERLDGLSRNRLTLLTLTLAEQLQQNKNAADKAIAVIGMAGHWPELLPVERIPQSAVGVVDVGQVQKHLFELAWQTLESAGYVGSKKERRIGIYLGLDSATCKQFYNQQNNPTDEFSLYEQELDCLFSHITSRLGLLGPTELIDVRELSSLVTISQACSALRNQQCQMALVGGVQPYLSNQIENVTDKQPAYSEYAGFLLLKPFDQAVQDKDPIMMIIQGGVQQLPTSSVRMATSTITADEKPLIDSMLINAGVELNQVDEIEIYDLATDDDEEQEVDVQTQLVAVLGQDNLPFIRTVESDTNHQALTAIVRLVNYYQKIRSTGIIIGEDIAEAVKSLPLKILSAFQHKGRRIHFLLSILPEQIEQETELEESTILVLSAHSEDSLGRLAADYHQYLTTYRPSLIDVCYTAAVGRHHFHQARKALLVSSFEDMQRQLSSFKPKKNNSRANHQLHWAFGGYLQGLLWQKHSCYQDEPAYQQALTECKTLFDSLLDRPLQQIISEPEKYQYQPRYLLPALFSLQYAMGRLWFDLIGKPERIQGEQFGEYSAACLCHIFSLEDAVKLVDYFAQVISHHYHYHQVLALDAELPAIGEVISDFPSLYSFEAEDNMIFSHYLLGEESEIDRFYRQMMEQNIPCQYQKCLVTDNRITDAELMTFYTLASAVDYHKPEVGYQPISSGKENKFTISSADYWLEHLQHSLFAFDPYFPANQELNKDKSLPFVPVSRLTIQSTFMLTLNQPEQNNEVVLIHDELITEQSLLTIIATLYEHGLDIHWSSLLRHGRRIALPVYPFEASEQVIPQHNIRIEHSANSDSIDIESANEQNKKVLFADEIQRLVQKPINLIKIPYHFIDRDDHGSINTDRVTATSDRLYTCEVSPLLTAHFQSLSAGSLHFGQIEASLFDLITAFARKIVNGQSIERLENVILLSSPSLSAFDENHLHVEVQSIGQQQFLRLSSQTDGSDDLHLVAKIQPNRTCTPSDLTKILDRYSYMPRIDDISLLTHNEDKLERINQYLKEQGINSPIGQLGESEQEIILRFMPTTTSLLPEEGGTMMFELFNHSLLFAQFVFMDETSSEHQLIDLSSINIQQLLYCHSDDKIQYCCIKKQAVTESSNLTMSLAWYDEQGEIIALIGAMRFISKELAVILEEASRVEINYPLLPSRQLYQWQWLEQPRQLVVNEPIDLKQILQSHFFLSAEYETYYLPYEEMMDMLEMLIADSLVESFQHLGFSFVEGEQFSRNELIWSCAIIPGYHHQQLSELLAILERQNYISRLSEAAEESWQILKGVKTEDPLSEFHWLKEHSATDQSFVSFSHYCLQRLPQLLTGQLNASALWSAESEFKQLMRSVYSETSPVLAMHSEISRIGTAILDQQKAAGREKLRLLEIGVATTDGHSQYEQSLSSYVEDFQFIDISRLSSPTLAKLSAFMVDELIESEPVFDLVIVSYLGNIMKDRQALLKWLETRLKPGGFLLLAEYLNVRAWSNVTLDLLTPSKDYALLKVTDEQKPLVKEEWYSYAYDTGLTIKALLSDSQSAEQTLIILNKQEQAPAWLIFADETPWCEKLLQQITDAGQSYIQVNAGDTFSCVEADHYHIDGNKQEDYQQMMAQLAERELLGVLFCWGHRHVTVTESPISALAETVCLWLYNLTQSLKTLPQETYPGLWLISCDDEADGSLIETLSGFAWQSIIWAVGNRLRSYHPELSYRLMNVSAETDMREVLLELTNPDEIELAILGNKRYLFSHTPVTQVVTERLHCAANASYLITSGLSRSGLLLAHWLQRQGAGTLILLDQENNEAERMELFYSLEKSGIKLVVAGADVVHDTALEALLLHWQEQFAPIKGVFYLDGGNASYTRSGEESLSAKEILTNRLDPIISLLRQLQDTSLDYLVYLLSGSTSSLLNGFNPVNNTESANDHQIMGSNALNNEVIDNTIYYFMSYLLNWRHKQGQMATAICDFAQFIQAEQLIQDFEIALLINHGQFERTFSHTETLFTLLPITHMSLVQEEASLIEYEQLIQLLRQHDVETQLKMLTALLGRYWCEIVSPTMEISAESKLYDDDINQSTLNRYCSKLTAIFAVDITPAMIKEVITLEALAQYLQQRISG